MRRPVVLLAAAAALSVSIAGMSAVTAGAAAPHGGAPLTRAQAITTHLLVQQGLAIALANGVLQGNLVLADIGLPGSSGVRTGTCEIDQGVPVKITSYKQPSQTKTILVDTLYYDTACTKPYITQSATLTSQDSAGGFTLNATESWTYVAPSGKRLGVFTANAVAQATDSALDLRGVGTFRSAPKAAPVSLGLTCHAPTNGNSSTSTWHCVGGVAQHFAGLKLSTGSLTPLTLTVASSAAGFGKVSFSGSGTQLRTSANPIGVGLTPAKALTLTGKSTPAGTDATKGSAAKFALFTPRPTGWTITDAAAHTSFALSVINNALALSGKVVDTKTKTALATLALDRSGTGTITYRGQPPTKVSSWLLAG